MQVSVSLWLWQAFLTELDIFKWHEVMYVLPRTSCYLRYQSAHISISYLNFQLPWIFLCLINPSSVFTVICNVTQNTVLHEHCHQKTVITAETIPDFSDFVNWFTNPLKNNIYVRSLFDCGVGCDTWTVDHFSQTVQQFFSVIIDVSIDFIDGLIFYYPQRTISFSYQALIMRNYNYTC